MLAKTLALVVALSACGTTALPPGGVCKQTSECESGLMCLDVAQFSGQTCNVVGKSCTITCAGDGDCSMFGAKFKCFAGCGADKTCMETASP